MEAGDAEQCRDEKCVLIQTSNGLLDDCLAIRRESSRSRIRQTRTRCHSKCGATKLGSESFANTVSASNKICERVLNRIVLLLLLPAKLPVPQMADTAAPIPPRFGAEIMAG